MEKEILGLVSDRNRILEEIIRISHLAISEFHHLDQGDIDHFFMTRKYFIEALIQTEDKIIASSMMDWSTFSFDTDYRGEYIKLSEEKKDKVGVIINQDRALSVLLERDLLEKTA